MSKHILNADALCQALYYGHLRKVINAVKAGSDLHPPLPINFNAKPYQESLLSPISMIWRWDWKNKQERCMQALDALLKAGADPNMPDELGRRGLALLLFIHGAQTPLEAMERLFQAKADPLLASFTTQGRSHANAMGLCVLGWMPDQAEAILRVCPAAAITPADPLDPPPLARLASNASGWTDEAGLRMTRMLLAHGATDDHRHIQNSPQALRWIAQAQAMHAEAQLSQKLPSSDSSTLARRTPRL